MNKVNFFGHEVTKLIVGDNPFNGHSYITDRVPGAEMKSYLYSGENKRNLPQHRKNRIQHNASPGRPLHCKTS